MVNRRHGSLTSFCKKGLPNCLISCSRRLNSIRRWHRIDGVKAGVNAVVRCLTELQAKKGLVHVKRNIQFKKGSAIPEALQEEVVGLMTVLDSFSSQMGNESMSRERENFKLPKLDQYHIT